MRTKCSFLLFFIFILPLALAKLTPNFYSSSCPEAESIIFNVVQRRFNTDRSITGALLRMHFHDCFSGNGCDASILIDSTIRSQPEKDSGSNLTVRGYEIIDEIKNALEQKCPSTVSCADIIALATRDAVALAGGRNYSLPTGRRDGLRSNADEVNLPGTSLSVPNVLQMFAEKGFNTTETVAILGVHTVGVVHCSFFQDRLPDSDMDPAFAQELSKACEASSGSDDPMTNLDHGTPTALDSQYYNQTLFKRGILQIDQALALDASTHDIVAHFANDEDDFQLSFANVMVKLGSLQVLTDGKEKLGKIAVLLIGIIMQANQIGVGDLNELEFSICFGIYFCTNSLSQNLCFVSQSIIHGLPCL